MGHDAAFMEKEIDILVLSDAAEMPHYATEEAAGADVRAHLKEPLLIPKGRSALVPTGLRLQIPSGYEIQVRPRSGLALRHQITVLNTPGTIDADYRGELQILLINHGEADFIVEPGMRIAQLVCAPCCHARYINVEELTVSSRGSGGFGHTGVR
jgi:dUTP pyrophosphatase